MDHEKSRLLKIANELAYYCFGLGAENMHIKILSKEDNYEISLQCEIKYLSQDSIDKLTQDLEIPRKEEIEEYLYELAGESQGFRELSLVGMMIDEVKINYDKSQFNITMVRRKEVK